MTYVMSDIHGNYELFAKMLETIDLKPDDELYVLGDVIDRGKDGIKLLKLFKASSEGNMHLLLGNHELMMLDARPDIKGDMNYWYAKKAWSNNGSAPTLTQYYKLSKDEQKELIKYIETLPVQQNLIIKGREFILCHAQPDSRMFTSNPLEKPEFERYRPEKTFQVWFRGRIGESDRAFNNKTIVYGHTPTHNRRIDINETEDCGTWINIDCGCSTGKVLGCLRLEDMTEFYVSPDN